MIFRKILITLALLPCLGFALLPVKYRFRMACRVAKWFRPFFWLLGVLKIYSIPLHGYREIPLVILVYALIKFNIKFKPELEIDSPQLIQNNEGVLILTCHLILNRLLIRQLSEQGRRVTVVTIMPTVAHYLGSSPLLKVIAPNSQSLIRIRQKIKAGEIVYLTVEMLEPNSSCQPLALDGQKYYISKTALQLVERTNLPVVFAYTRATKQGQPVVKLARPSSSLSTIAVEELCQFLSAEVEQSY